MFDLTGQCALVTGASGGLGQSIVKALIQQGAHVAITGTRENVLHNLLKTYGSKCHPFVCHLDQDDAVDALIPSVEKTLGKLDILVNNAGITKDNLTVRLKNDAFQDVLKINLEVPFKLIRAALKGMMKQRHGRIINITSVVGTTGNPGQANYCASKAGLVGLTKSIAQEVATRGITVNCISPGFMASSMTEILTDEQKKSILSSIPMGAMGHGDAIGAAVVYLASESYMTGQTLHINGGMAMV